MATTKVTCTATHPSHCAYSVQACGLFGSNFFHAPGSSKQARGVRRASESKRYSTRPWIQFAHGLPYRARESRQQQVTRRTDSSSLVQEWQTKRANPLELIQMDKRGDDTVMFTARPGSTRKNKRTLFQAESAPSSAASK